MKICTASGCPVQWCVKDSSGLQRWFINSLPGNYPTNLARKLRSATKSVYMILFNQTESTFTKCKWSWRKALKPAGAGRARCAQDTVGWHGQLNMSKGEQLCSSNLGTGIPSPSPDAFRGLTFSQSDIGTISSFRPTARPAAWSEGVKHDAPDNLCVSHAVLFTSENSSDSCGGSSVCFPGVSSSSGTNDLLFPVLSASLVTDRWARFPELWDSNVIWVALVAGGAAGESRAGQGQLTLWELK